MENKQNTIRVPLEEMTEIELKDELRSRRANLSGTKAELLVRLVLLRFHAPASSSEEKEDEKMYGVAIVESQEVHLQVMASNEDEARERAMEGEGERVCVGNDWVESVTDVNEM